MPLKIYNTLTKQLEHFEPADPARITFYSCGPTVYDDAHIGNFRSFLAADLLRRWLESPICTLSNDPPTPVSAGKPRLVVQVMNITDVGHMTEDDAADGGGRDKMELAAERLAQAKKSGKLPPDAGVDPSDPSAIARFYEARFMEDALALGLKVAADAQSDASLMPRATDNIPQMRTVIEHLLANDCAYPAGEPGGRAIYFDVQRFAKYGDLSGNTLDKLRGGAGGRVDDANTRQKRHPADFLLWKEDESHKMKWDSPRVPDQDTWGQGYPGWHIECTAMALDRLAAGGLEGARTNHARIDLHSGGEDNIFPHHECEIAQSCCFTGSDTFAAHWFHPRFLKVDGEKMSKSKGTMYTLRDLTAKGFDPAAVRLELIKTHYRANADFSMQGLKDSARRVDRWRNIAKGAYLCTQSLEDRIIFDQAVRHDLEDFAEALADDLNIAKALSCIDSFATSSIGSHGDAQTSASREDSWKKRLGTVDLPNESRTDLIQLMKDLNSSDKPTVLIAALHLIDNILGVIFRPIDKGEDTGIALYQPGVTPSEEIESLLTRRAEAKKAKDFAAADGIRDRLAGMGLSIMDKPGGKVEVALAN
ncbi:MAG: hypothetical protein WD114_06645 [Phycisphaerales bacterium]